MANAAMHQCAIPGCRALTNARYCVRHSAGREYDGRIKHDYRKWYDRKDYRIARDVFMFQHPVCVVCGALATDLDHIKPHKGDWALFWDVRNWQSLCATCHGRKTQRGQ